MAAAEGEGARVLVEREKGEWPLAGFIEGSGVQVAWWQVEEENDGAVARAPCVHVRRAEGDGVKGYRARWASSGREDGPGEKKRGLRPFLGFFLLFCFSFSKNFREKGENKKIK